MTKRQTDVVFADSRRDRFDARPDNVVKLVEIYCEERPGRCVVATKRDLVELCHYQGAEQMGVLNPDHALRKLHE